MKFADSQLPNWKPTHFRGNPPFFSGGGKKRGTLNAVSFHAPPQEGIPSHERLRHFGPGFPFGHFSGLFQIEDSSQSLVVSLGRRKDLTDAQFCRCREEIARTIRTEPIETSCSIWRDSGPAVQRFGVDCRRQPRRGQSSRHQCQPFSAGRLSTYGTGPHDRTGARPDAAIAILTLARAPARD